MTAQSPPVPHLPGLTPARGHLSDFQALASARADRLAGLYVAVTRRCPLSCAHCSTRSSPHADERPIGPHLERFFASIASSTRPPPRYIYFTGGEPLLHPALVTRLAAKARQFRARTHLISSGFFGKSARLAPALDTLLSRYIDGITFSWDVFHSEFLDFHHLCRAVKWCQERGLSVSIQHTYVPTADDPFVACFGRELPGVPVFSSPLTRVGRAADNNLVPLARATGDATRDADPGDNQSADSPCLVASWPVISYYGQIVACCNQSIIDAEPDAVPAHLKLGTVFEDTWSDISARRAIHPTLDVIETRGPQACYAGQDRPQRSQCDACRALPERRGTDHAGPSQGLYLAVREVRRERLMGYIRATEHDTAHDTAPPHRDEAQV